MSLALEEGENRGREHKPSIDTYETGQSFPALSSYFLIAAPSPSAQERPQRTERQRQDGRSKLAKSRRKERKEWALRKEGTGGGIDGWVGKCRARRASGSGAMGKRVRILTGRRCWRRCASARRRQSASPAPLSPLCPVPAPQATVRARERRLAP